MEKSSQPKPVTFERVVIRLQRQKRETVVANLFICFGLEFRVVSILVPSKIEIFLCYEMCVAVYFSHSFLAKTEGPLGKLQSTR